jgi:hypothetical protein
MNSFVIQAALNGDLPMLNTLLKLGGSMDDIGAICVLEGNPIYSNIVGAASWNGRSKFLEEVVIVNLQSIDIDFKIQ